MIQDSALREYAERLEKAGFTVYVPHNPTARYFRYSRLVNGKECFGYVQRDWDRSTGYSHTMPIKPSIENGSSMWVDGVPDELSVEAARKVARPSNRNPLVGTQANYDDPRWAHLYARREPAGSRSDPFKS